MWEANQPPPEDSLRQGDFLRRVMLPKLKLPLAAVHVPGVDLPKTSPLQAVGVARDFLVVTQCCEVENGDTVAVAPVLSTPPLNEVLRASLDSEEPPLDDAAVENALDAGGADGDGDDEPKYAFDLLRLQPLAGLIEEGPGRYVVADLGEIISLSGDLQPLKAQRRARMTPEARRLLRIKLMYFFGRVEEEDAEQLDALNIPPGPTPPPG